MRLLILNARSVRIERDGSCLCRSSAVVMAASSVDGMSFGLRFYFDVCDGVVLGVHYGCSECGVSCDLLSVCVNEVRWRPCRVEVSYRGCVYVG